MASPFASGPNVAQVPTDETTQQQLVPAVRTRSMALSSAEVPTVTKDHVASAVAAALPPVKEKRKVGRPLAFKGDINSKDLTEAERRRIKRRVANRESARRIRHKRQEALGEMQGRMDTMQQQTATIAAQIQQVQAQKMSLADQLADMQRKWQAALEENKQLQEHMGCGGVGGGAPPVVSHSSAFEDSMTADINMRVPSITSPPLYMQQHDFAAFLPPVSSGGSIASGCSAVTSGQPGGSPRVPTASAFHGPGITITTAAPTYNVVTVAGGFPKNGGQDVPHTAAPFGDAQMPSPFSMPSASGDLAGLHTGPPFSDLATMPSLPERLPSLRETLDWLLP